jgi:hypothetical protein
MTPEETLKKIENLHATDLLPQSPDNWDETQSFLQQVVEILYDYIKEENNRNSKILDFHQPEEMKKLLDLSIPEKPMNLGELLKVKYFSFLHIKAHLKYPFLVMQ